ncbi:MAG: hypothetical protein M0R06_01045 [Sphaerochaeta sp.]|jgi:hypothetical protein|nr:hypothetical protein [Sphaerochaeta sp.]
MTTDRWPHRYIDLAYVAGSAVSAENRLPTVSKPYYDNIAEGDESGHVGWSKIGFNADIGTTEEDIWVGGGTYVFPTAASYMAVSSTSANDSASGTGARTVTIRYLDSTYASASESVTLTGSTAVVTAASNIYRVNAFRVSTAGSSHKAEGAISLKNTGGTITYSQIAASYTRARNITYTVPLGKALYITSTTFSVYGATKGIRYTTRATYDSDSQTVTDFFLPYFELAMGNGALYRPLEIPAYFPATTSIKVSGVADAAGAICSVALRGWLEDA